MSVREVEFELGEGAHLDLEAKSGKVTLRGRPGSSASVVIDGGDADDWEVAQLGSSLTVQSPRGKLWGGRSARVHVELPLGADATVKTASADVAVLGALGAVRVRTASGDVRLDDATRLDANSASGDLRAESVSGDTSCSTASGDVDVASVAGRVNVSTASGNVRVGRAGDDVEIGSASGDIRVDRYDGSDIAVKSLSGDVTVGLPSGIRVEPDLTTVSGRTRLPERASSSGDEARRIVRVRVRTVSGDIVIQRA